MLRRRAGLALAASLVVSSLVASSPARAQEIVLDRFVALGDVVAFESRSEPGAYYYAPTRARLARGSEGRPRFSFLRYVERADAGVDETPSWRELAVARSLDPARGGPTGEMGGNSAFRLAGVWERLAVGPDLAATLTTAPGPVLLVDDVVSSRWTMTVAGRALRLAGAPGVLPFALAVDG